MNRKSRRPAAGYRARNARANFFFLAAACASWGSAAAFTKALEGAGWWMFTWLVVMALGLAGEVVSVFAERAYRGRSRMTTVVFAGFCSGIALAVPLQLGYSWAGDVTAVLALLPLGLALIWARRHGT